MAFRFYTDQITSDAANASLIQAARGDAIIFTRSARYIAGGTNAHVVFLKASSTLAIDGELYSGSGATVTTAAGSTVTQVRVGESGLVSSAGGVGIDFAGKSATLLNAGEVSGTTAINSVAAATRIGNDGALTGSAYAISLSSADARVDNRGDVSSAGIGIILTGGTTNQVVTNSGAVSALGGTGVLVLTHGDATVANSGTITGALGVSITTYTADEAGERRFENTGTVSGTAAAFSGSYGDDVVMNAGTLIGRTLLLAGDDTYDGRGGTAGRVDGGDGDDTLTGGDLGRDVLIGGAGDDVLSGGAGNDILMPGLRNGQDVDYVDGGAGRDLVSFADIATGVTIRLYDDFIYDPTLVLTSIEGAIGGSGDDTFLGDAGANRFYGGDGDDTLDGNEGRDLLVGGAGNDRYYGDNLDTIIERANGGDDVLTVYESAVLPLNVETLVLSGKAFAGKGNAQDNSLLGNSMGNILDGRGGNDYLQGGGGADDFEISGSYFKTGVVTIGDFATGVDNIEIFGGTTIPDADKGQLAAKYFYVGTAAHDADDRFIFNPTTHALLYDADGTGGIAAIQIATVDGTAPVAADIVIY